MKVPERDLHDYISEISEHAHVRAGAPLPFGTQGTEGGVNFAIFSRDASRVRLELFDHPEDAVPARVIELDRVRQPHRRRLARLGGGDRSRSTLCLSRGWPLRTGQRTSLQQIISFPRRDVRLSLVESRRTLKYERYGERTQVPGVPTGIIETRSSRGTPTEVRPLGAACQVPSNSPGFSSCRQLRDGRQDLQHFPEIARFDQVVIEARRKRTLKVALPSVPGHGDEHGVLKSGLLT